MSEETLSGGAVRRGLILKEQRRYAEAARYFRDALAQDPRDAFALHQLAVCQLQTAGGAPAALETVGHALALEPNDPDHWVLKAFVLCSLRRAREALEAAAQALALAPTSPQAFTAQAQAFLQLERWPEAEVAARQALYQDADNAVAANQLAHALRLQNKMNENAEQLAGMLARDPLDAWTHANAGWAALQRGGSYRQAETHFREALRLDPENDYARDGLLQAFKARSPLYRAYLSYCFWVQRLGRAHRFLLILGLFLVPRFAGAFFTGPAASLGVAVSVLYLLGVLWVWVAGSVGNLFLLLDPYARHVLRRSETADALVVGGGVVLGLGLLLVGGLVGRSPVAVVVGATLIGTAFPWSMTFTHPHRLGRWCFGSLGVVVLLAGAVLLTKLFVPALDDRLVAGFVGAGLLSAVGSTWLGNLRALRR